MSIPASYISVRWQHREQGIQRSFKYFNFWRQKRRKVVDPTPVVCNCIPVFWWLSIIKSYSWNLKIRLFPVQNKRDILLIVLSAKPVLWTSWLSSIRWEVSKKSVRFSFDICQSWHYISFLQYHPKLSWEQKGLAEVLQSISTILWITNDSTSPIFWKLAEVLFSSFLHRCWVAQYTRQGIRITQQAGKGASHS